MDSVIVEVLMFWMLLPLGIILAYLVNKEILSMKKSFLIYWGMFLLAEIISIVFLTNSIQFIPPSISISVYYGLIAFIIYLVKCICCKISKKEKFKYIGMAFLANFIVIPILLIWL